MPSENQRLSSLAASFASAEEWTRLSSIVSAISPRTVPGSASTGLVAPIMRRIARIAFSPSTSMATIGPEVR